MAIVKLIHKSENEIVCLEGEDGEKAYAYIKKAMKGRRVGIDTTCQYRVIITNDDDKHELEMNLIENDGFIRLDDPDNNLSDYFFSKEAVRFFSGKVKYLK